MQQPVLLSSDFGPILRKFSRSRRKTSQQYSELTVWSNRTNSFEQSFWCQRKLWACSWLCSSPHRLFSVSVSLGFPCTAHAFFPERVSNHCQGLRRTFTQICTKLDAVPLPDPPWNRIRPHTRLQIKGRKTSARPPSCVKYCILTPKIC
jgi:hypothetical protein